LRFFSKDLRFAFNLWMALGGMVVPQLAATSAHPGFFRPGLTGMRLANWRQQNQNKIDWVTRLVRRASAFSIFASAVLRNHDAQWVFP
jgi:hypothetical protein